MKILHIDFDDLKNPMGGGQAVRTFELNRRLSKKHQITVVTSNYPNAKDEVIDNIQYIRVGRGEFPWNFITFLVSIPKVVKNSDFDLLVENFTPPIGPAFTPLFTKKPVVAMVEWAFAWEMSQKYKLPFFLFQEIGLKFYKNFLFPSQAIKERLLRKEKVGLKIKILPNFISTSIANNLKKTAFGDYLLFLGRLDIHQKGIDLLLFAFKKIANKIKAPLYIAGEGREKEKIRKYIKKLGLQKRVILLGKVEGEKKNNLLKKARVVCFPSRYEVCSLVVGESLLLKKPIVAFNLPEIKEVTQNQAIFAKPFDIDDLAAKIIYAYQNAPKISQSIKFKPLPSWDEVAKEQEAFYKKVLSQ